MEQIHGVVFVTTDSVDPTQAPNEHLERYLLWRLPSTRGFEFDRYEASGRRVHPKEVGPAIGYAVADLALGVVAASITPQREPGATGEDLQQHRRELRLKHDITATRAGSVPVPATHRSPAGTTPGHAAADVELGSAGSEQR